MKTPKCFLRELEYSPGKTLVYELYYVTADDEVPHLVEWMRPLKAVGFDIETDKLPMNGKKIDRKAPFPFRTKIATLQFGNPFVGEIPRAYVVDARLVSAEALQPVLQMLGSREILKLGMNIGFECQFMQYHYKTPLRRVACIQVAELLMRAGLFPLGQNDESRIAYGHTSMEKLAKRYLKIQINKDPVLRTSFYSTPPGQLSPLQLEYAADDTLYPFYIARYQRREIEERTLSEPLAVEFDTIPVLADAELTGLWIDQAEWRQLWQEATQRRADAEAELDNRFRFMNEHPELFSKEQDPSVRPRHSSGKELNYDSVPHLKWALKEYCRATGWPVEIVTNKKRALELKAHYGKEWLATRKRKVTPEDVPDYLVPEKKYCLLLSVKKDFLKLAKIRGQLPANLVDTLVEYSEQGQRADAFGRKFLQQHVVEETGRIHPQFHQLLTSTGRISTQPNSQNIPRDIRYRACFKPRPGYKYVILDYSQIEPRLSAQVSDDPVYVSTFLQADDIYCKVAEAMSGTYPDKKTEEGNVMRQVFKTIVLALAYRMGPNKLRDRLTLALEPQIMAGTVECPTIAYATELHRGFFNTCTKLHAYQELCTSMADGSRDHARRVYDRYLRATVTYVSAPCGRKRFFPPGYKRLFTEPPNAPIQGCSATVTKYAAVLVQEFIDQEKLDAHVLNLVHDELVWEVREDQAVAFAVKAKELMEQAGRRWITKVPVIAEFPKKTNGVVDRWLKEAA